MAKKARTPPPPRQQGPRKREAAPISGRLSGQRNAVLSGVLAGGVIVAVALTVFLTHRGSESTPANDSIPAPTAKLAAAGCTLKNVPPRPPRDRKNFHNDVPSLTAKVSWSTYPPSAGAHYQLWAVWQFYQEPVNPRMIVHNEEHGAVVIWWGDKVPQATVAKLQQFYNESPEGMVGTPLPGLRNKIALTAWTGNPRHYYQDNDYGIGHVATCTTYNAAAFRAFRDAYRGKGPEGVPLSADKPGTGPG